MFFVQKVSKPIVGSKFIKQKKDLDLFSYNEQLTSNEKAKAKTLIVFGQTGCGKSTFLNAIVNYIAGVEMEDTFRYIVIIENDSSQLNSITSTINDYYIKNSRTGQVYRLIDTPGFGDTGGIQKDRDLVKMITDKFKNDIEWIHCILFVMKASTTRVTSYQQYVFQSVMDLFDKEIAPNFVFIFTFSDAGNPQVLGSVMDKQYGFGNYWNQIIEPKYIQVNNCGFFQKIDEKDSIKSCYWKIGIQCLDKLFKKVMQIEPKSLQLSRQMIRKKETLSCQISHATQIIQHAISKRENIKRNIQAIVQHRHEINNNKDFTYQVLEDQWYSDNVNANVTRCKNPQCFSEKNCHIDCAYGDNDDKKKCVAMDSNGYCRFCKCHYVVHTNSKIIRKIRQVMKTKINAQNKNKYDKSNILLKTSENALLALFDQLQAQMVKVINATKQMKILQDSLVKMQMSQRKPESTKAYLYYLIQNENREQNPNYTKRINGYLQAIKQLQFQEKLMQGQGDEKIMNIYNETKEAFTQNIIACVEPQYFQQFRDKILKNRKKIN